MKGFEKYGRESTVGGREGKDASQHSSPLTDSKLLRNLGKVSEGSTVITVIVHIHAVSVKPCLTS